MFDFLQRLNQHMPLEAIVTVMIGTGCVAMCCRLLGPNLGNEDDAATFPEFIARRKAHKNNNSAMSLILIVTVLTAWIATSSYYIWHNDRIYVAM